MAKDQKGNDVSKDDVANLQCTVLRLFNPKKKDKDGQDTDEPDLTRDDIDVAPVVNDPNKAAFHWSLKRRQFDGTPIKGEPITLLCVVVDVLEPKTFGGDTDFTKDNLRLRPSVVDETKPNQLLSVKSNQVQAQ